MAGALPHYKLGPASYVAGAPILGGSLVRAIGTSESSVTVSGTAYNTTALEGAGVVQNDSATTATLLGVAATDAGVSQYPEGTAAIPGSWSGAPAGDTVNGDVVDPLLDISTLGYTVSVYNNIDIHVRYSSTAAFGALLYADAVGGVCTTNTGTLVGRCTQPGGVTGSPTTSAPVSARAYIRV